MNVYVSIPRVVDILLAGSALSAVTSVVERPPLFTPDHTAALSCAAMARFRDIALSLTPYLQSVDCDDTDALLLRFDTNLRFDTALTGGAIEHIIAMRVLAQYTRHCCPAVSEACAAEADGLAARLHALMLRQTPAPGRIRPHG